MPDRDVFNRKVERGWQTAARLLIGGTDDDEALAAAIRALVRMIKANGRPGLDQVVQIVADALRSPRPTTARAIAIAKLDDVRLHQATRQTEIAVASAKGILAGRLESGISSTESGDKENLHEHLAIRIVTDLAMTSLFPAPLLAELVEAGDISFQGFSLRRQRANKMIVTSPQTRRLALQLLADPSGTSVKAPQMARRKKSQAEMLVVALTD